MLFFFSEKPGNKKIIQRIAIAWTMVILLLCFLPSDEVPNVRIPFADKWAHFIMFGLFTFLWLASLHQFKIIHLLIVFLTGILYGWLVEVLQGQLSFLGRSRDDMDTLADGFGGLLGVIVFYIGYLATRKKEKKKYT